MVASMLIEAKRDQILRQLKAAGVIITESATGALSLHQGQRRIVITDVRYLDNADLRALGVLPAMTPGRWRV